MLEHRVMLYGLVYLLLSYLKHVRDFTNLFVRLENCFRVVNVCPVLEIPFLEFCYSVLFSCF